jgi:hypothetical protein
MCIGLTRKPRSESKPGVKRCETLGRPSLSQPRTSGYSKPNTEPCRRAMDTTHTVKVSKSRLKPGRSTTECFGCLGISCGTDLCRMRSSTQPSSSRFFTRNLRFLPAGPRSDCAAQDSPTQRQLLGVWTRPLAGRRWSCVGAPRTVDKPPRESIQA